MEKFLRGETLGEALRLEGGGGGIGDYNEQQPLEFIFLFDAPITKSLVQWEHYCGKQITLRMVRVILTPRVGNFPRNKEAVISL